MNITHIMKKSVVLLPLSLLLLLGSCRSLGSLTTGDIIAGADSIVRVGGAVAKTFEDFTPEQEYFIGRAVGAQVLARYQPMDNAGVNHYVNLLGQTLAKSSDMPKTFGGYHFLVLYSNDINAFAAPGGLVFITKGMLDCCPDENALAAVLAHEIAHVNLKHGTRSIENSRITEAFGVMAEEGARHFAPSEVRALTATFQDSILDVTKTMIDSGYSRSYEREADLLAVKILRRVGYPTAGMFEMLQAMGQRLRPGGMDFAKTHPSPQDRIAELNSEGVRSVQAEPNPARQERFAAAVGNM